MAGSSLLFIGYSFADVTLRFLFRGLRGNLEESLNRMSVAVQLPYDNAHPNKEKAEQYITEYFGSMDSARVLGDGEGVRHRAVGSLEGVTMSDGTHNPYPGPRPFKPEEYRDLCRTR